MKIAVLSSHTPSLFWFRMDMMKEFIAKGHSVVAVGNEKESDWKERFERNGIRYVAADVQRNGTNPLRDIKTLFSLIKILKTEKPDKVFSYQAKTIIYGNTAAWLVGVKSIFSLVAGIGSVFLADNFMSKTVARILVWQYRFALGKAEKIFFQNPDDIELFTSKRMAKPSKIVIINGSGVNLERFKPLPMPDKTAFLCISRLICDKGVVEYLEAAKRIKNTYPDTEFYLVGPFDTNPSAISEKQLYEYVDAGAVKYFGEQADVVPYLNMCSVFILPSYREGTPKTVLEAMASGRAVITTDAPGCKETVTDGENGFLVPVRDVDALCNAILKFIKDPDLALDMGVKGRKIAEEKYDVLKINAVIVKTMSL